MTILEFILAQGPHYMQGTLIGTIFLKIAVSPLFSTVSESTPAGCYWEKYAAISGIVFISLIIVLLHIDTNIDNVMKYLISM